MVNLLIWTWLIHYANLVPLNSSTTLQKKNVKPVIMTSFWIKLLNNVNIAQEVNIWTVPQMLARHAHQTLNTTRQKKYVAHAIWQQPNTTTKQQKDVKIALQVIVTVNKKWVVNYVQIIPCIIKFLEHVLLVKLINNWI